MSIEEAKQIYAEHLMEIMKKSRDGDKTVKALQIIGQYLQEDYANKKDNKFDMLINLLDIDLLVAITNGNVSVFENGYKIEKIEELTFKYNKEELPSLEIKQTI